MKKKVLIVGIALLVTAVVAVSVTAAAPGKPPAMESGSGVGPALFGPYPAVRHVSLTLVANGANGGDSVFVLVQTGIYGWSVLDISGNGHGVVEFDATEWEITVLDSAPTGYDVQYSWTTLRPN